MRTLFICLSEYGKENRYFLNRNYSHKQIAEAMRRNRFCGSNAENVFKKGIYLEEDLELKLNGGDITEMYVQGFNFTSVCKKTSVTVHPDATCELVYSPTLLDKISDFFRKIIR